MTPRTRALRQSRDRAASRPSILRELYDDRWWLVVGIALSVAAGLTGLFQ